MTAVLTGRTRLRRHIDPTTNRQLLVLQVEERKGAFGIQPNRDEVVALDAWRDANPSDLFVYDTYMAAS